MAKKKANSASSKDNLEFKEDLNFPVPSAALLRAAKRVLKLEDDGSKLLKDARLLAEGILDLDRDGQSIEGQMKTLRRDDALIDALRPLPPSPKSPRR